MGKYVAHFEEYRYHLYCGTFYATNGGWEDFICAFETKAQAIKYAFENQDGPELNYSWEWYHVVDSFTNEIVAKGKFKVLPDKKT